MKAIRILGRNIKHAFQSVFRNFSLSIASVVCTSITLILVSLTLIISVTINNFTKDLESELTILVVLDRGTTIEDELNVKNRISKLDNVEVDNIIVKNKEQIRKEMMEESESFKTIMQNWTEETNILQSEVIVPVKDVKKLKETAAEIEQLDLVNNVQFGEAIVDEIISIFDVVKKATIVIIIALIVVAVFLICNTIKLTIFSRRNEIEIMRLVGTSNTVIKLPFVFEGLFLGIIGSIIPIILTVYGYFLAYEKLHGYFIVNIIKMVKPLPFVFYSSAVLLVIGAIVGMIGSYRSARKYLKI